MSSRNLRLRCILFAVACLAACAAPGVPEPPSLELARPVRDLKAFRKGNEVHLAWSVPTETTDRQNFRHARQTQICRVIGSQMGECGTPVAEIAAGIPGTESHESSRWHRTSTNTPTPQASYTDQLSPELEQQSPASDLVYAVNVLNSYGKSAGLSNQVRVPAAPVLAPPANFTAELTAEGVKLAWTAVWSVNEIPGLRYAYRVYRRNTHTNHDSIAGEIQVAAESHPTLLDASFEWENTYDYRLTVVTFIERSGASGQVEGNDTPPVRVITHDIFPPATPSGLQAVFSGPGQKPFIDLVWSANSEPDFANYNVHRHEAGGDAVRINTEPVKSPAFRDFDVLPGHEYIYSVSAVDVRGNESQISAEASEAVPPTK